MKTSALTIALVAVASSLVTVGTIELLRSSRPDSRAALAIESAPEPPSAPAARGAEPLVPVRRDPDPPTDHEDRLVELERRIAALELGSTPGRAPVPAAGNVLPPENDLRVLVLDWVAEEREARSRAKELEEEKRRRKELEFEARFHAYMLSQEHELSEWERDKLVAAFLAVETRRMELEQDIDPLTDDPEQVERRYVEFDEWAERYQREELGELYDQISDE